MKRKNSFLKGAVLASSLLLFAGFLLYRTGNLESIYRGQTLSAQSIDSLELHTSQVRLYLVDTTNAMTTVELDSTEFQYLVRLFNNHVAPLGLHIFSYEAVLRRLAEAEEQEMMLMYSSKSAPVPADLRSEPIYERIRKSVMASRSPAVELEIRPIDDLYPMSRVMVPLVPLDLESIDSLVVVDSLDSDHEYPEQE